MFDSLFMFFIIISIISIFIGSFCLWCILELDAYVRDKLFGIDYDIKKLSDKRKK